MSDERPRQNVLVQLEYPQATKRSAPELYNLALWLGGLPFGFGSLFLLLFFITSFHIWLDVGAIMPLLGLGAMLIGFPCLIGYYFQERRLASVPPKQFRRQVVVAGVLLAGNVPLTFAYFYAMIGSRGW